MSERGTPETCPVCRRPRATSLRVWLMSAETRCVNIDGGCALWALERERARADKYEEALRSWRDAEAQAGIDVRVLGKRSDDTWRAYIAAVALRQAALAGPSPSEPRPDDDADMCGASGPGDVVCELDSGHDGAHQCETLGVNWGAPPAKRPPRISEEEQAKRRPLPPAVLLSGDESPPAPAGRLLASKPIVRPDLAAAVKEARREALESDTPEKVAAVALWPWHDAMDEEDRDNVFAAVVALVREERRRVAVEALTRAAAQVCSGCMEGLPIATGKRGLLKGRPTHGEGRFCYAGDLVRLLSEYQDAPAGKGGGR